MRAMALCMAVAACGPGLVIVPAKGHEIAQQTLTTASGNAVAIEKLLRGSLMDGGLWFADPSCAPFANPGPIKPDQFHGFARCLATVHLTVSERTDQLPDVTVLTYEPGIEIEARVVDEDAGPRLSWIGFESRRDDSDSLPTISPALLESLRIEGDPRPVVADAQAYLWLKLCLDAEGSVAAATPFEASSLQTARELRSIASTWKFKPSPVGAACAMVRLGAPPPKPVLPFPPPPGTPGSDPPAMIGITGLHRIAGEKNIVPDDDTKTAIGRSGVDRVIGTYKMCIDTAGHVTVVVPLRMTGFAAYDQRIMGTIQATWTYEPYEDEHRPVPVCSAVTFIYSQRTTNGTTARRFR